jgi:hypothetical protein
LYVGVFLPLVEVLLAVLARGFSSSSDEEVAAAATLDFCLIALDEVDPEARLTSSRFVDGSFLPLLSGTSSSEDESAFAADFLDDLPFERGLEDDLEDGLVDGAGLAVFARVLSSSEDSASAAWKRHSRSH